MNESPLDNKNLSLESRQNAGEFSNTGAENKPKDTQIEIVRDRLDNAVANHKVTPEVAKAMNERIAAIESGIAPVADTEQLSAEIEKFEKGIGKNLDGDVLAAALNSDIDLSKEAAPRDLTNKLMQQTAKRYSEDNKS